MEKYSNPMTYLSVAKGRAETIESHLRVCPECRQEADKTRNYIEDMRSALMLLEMSSASSEPRDVRGRAGKDRRLAPRMSCDTPVLVSYTSDKGINRLAGRLVDMSAYGGGLMLPTALPIDACARIRARESELACTVRYCRKVKNGFRAGIQLAHGCRRAA